MPPIAQLAAAAAATRSYPAVPGLPDIAITSEIVAAIRAGAWIVFNLSGGKDSSAALFAVNLQLDSLGHPRARRMAIHADLGRAEWDSTPDTVARIAASADVPLTVVRRAAGDLVDRWIQRFESGKRRYEALETYNLIGPWSSASLRFCQSEMKAAVIGPALARMLRGQQIISVLGLRRDESHNRAATPIAKADLRHAKAGNRHGTAITLWHPIAYWNSEDVFRAHGTLGITLHEAYSIWGATRLSCRYCIFASLHDLSASAAAPANTEAYRELVGIEARSTFPFQPTRWLADISPHLLSGGLRADVERAKADQLERRHLEASMPAGLRYVKGWPPRMPTLAEAEDIAAARRPILARHRLENRYPTGSAVQARFAELRVAAGRQMSS
ncbi:MULTISPECIES: phosphoadenosine phosphosulfate reductase domain-containing protein [Sphingomonadaceae]|jgi:3'-phosphoadenosine 5'-phosphosulfate sulfotransferase (PAPS reductase)/FAD synthetase|uniref:Phosphoadenosine phosphosulfate reductase n=5 Tax=Sphingomonadaceae TaxID=41297 RepID=A0A1L3ZX28_9SPHN|nr:MULTISPECIES: phosphoadenosine phosphosulfate reductase family protein [Sphingomonadaceae]API60192.1 phosphoadenosine phosphosulfate reductase [Tardibacter chloracetimidivorans]NJB98936.1 3'-phosphoadenosine 5'-phosphosulfate sulfotransferase (PAPS reductase)/FAD synthetase [Sphingomonas trueperi]QPS14829.1 phosphoadenosine phosphosulfate reductase family protein [Sphingomonas paucimobilis]QPT10882.1 phosphoadenosine phosphosulfate reductase family protein [Sphingomonas paucimobilis]RSV5152